MLFWIFVIVLIISIVMWYIGDHFFFEGDDMICCISALTFFLSGFVVLVSIIIMIYSHAGAVADINACQAEYDSLVYQYESGMYDNDIGLYRKELMDNIREWNRNLSYKQAVQDDFWLGIYYPNVYDQLELIELEE